MFPIVGLPDSIKDFLLPYRDVFCRDEGFEWFWRYELGLLVSPNKTVQGIYDAQSWPEGVDSPSRRAMHNSLFESDLSSDALIARHRKLISSYYRSSGRSLLSLDWTFANHAFGPKIFGNKKRYNYVQRRSIHYQIVPTVVVANRDRLDGLEVVVQTPTYEKEEKAYLKATTRTTYESQEQLQERLLELLTYHYHKKGYKKLGQLFLELVQTIEEEGHFPKSNYAFDNGVLCRPLTKYIESRGKFWISELEKSRLIFWQNKYQQIQVVAKELRQQSPQSFREFTVRKRNGKIMTYWAFSKAVRLKKYGKIRIFICHESQDLSDEPRFLVSNALHWNAKRALQDWSYRWTSETFHEFGKQHTGLESAQFRNEEAVKKHFRYSCLAQSILQNVVAQASTSEKFEFAKGDITIGQRCQAVTREIFKMVLDVIKNLLEQGKSCQQILEQLIPT